ncbi:hypothetical protein [Streptomyces sp. NK08204]|uniref:hypothetical protein n=1 Tax=Streptomyces sp. NK08204 TaxID=2873260 RepID=UPI001CEC0840|nr:hypothetical protein [Streptomyces sp. NK08204]
MPVWMMAPLKVSAAVSATPRDALTAGAPTAPYPFETGTELYEELEHLRAVASAYRLISPADVRALLTNHSADRF